MDFDSNINVYTSALVVYHTPSVIHGMVKEHIHAMLKWGKYKVPHYDTAFAITDPDIAGMGGLDMSRVQLFKHCDRKYLCTLLTKD